MFVCNFFLQKPPTAFTSVGGKNLKQSLTHKITKNLNSFAKICFILEYSKLSAYFYKSLS